MSADIEIQVELSQHEARALCRIANLFYETCRETAPELAEALAPAPDAEVGPLLSGALKIETALTAAGAER